MDKIFCKFRGRLGNHMFIIAFGEAISKRYGIPIRYIKSNHNIDFSFLNKPIDIIGPTYDIKECRIITHSILMEYKDIDIDLDDNTKIIFDGLWLSEKYFGKELAFELFGIKDNVKDVIKRIYPNIEDYVSIHIRRTDFLKYHRVYKTLTHEEIDKSIRNFDKDLKFLIISDDLCWCKDEFKEYNNFIYADKVSNIINKELLDLYSMTLCRDNIISNSTFSWWGAYLNIHEDRKVYYSEPWKKTNSTSYDIIPENNNWIPINDN